MTFGVLFIKKYKNCEPKLKFSHVSNTKIMWKTLF